MKAIRPTAPSRDPFPLVVAVILLGTLVLMMGQQLGQLDRRVTALESTIGGAR